MKNNGLLFCLGLASLFFSQTLHAKQSEADASHLAEIRAKAEQGDATAQSKIGDAFLSGMFGVTQDYVEAVKWYRKAAEQGQAAGQCSLGICYQGGLGVAKNEEEAVKLYRKAAEQNFAFAQYNLSVCYGSGLGVTKDGLEAAKWCRKAAENNNANAQYNLGIYYATGEGVAKDEAEAFKWLHKAAEQNHADALNILGYFYEHGQGVAQDDAEAMKWYRKAAENNHAEGQFNLGCCYLYGRGVTKDLVEGGKWWLLAAMQDQETAKKAVRTFPQFMSQKQIVKVKQRAGDWLEQRKGNVAPAVFVAIMMGDLSALQASLKSETNMETCWNDMTPLIAAVTRCNSNALEITRYLVKKGANLHANIKKQTALSSVDFANYLSDDPSERQIVDVLVSESLAPIENVPSVIDIRRKISAAVIKKSKAHSGDVLIQLFDIRIEDAVARKFVVACDAGLIDENKIQMFEVTSHSRNIMPEPKGVSTHLYLIGELNDDGVGKMMTQLNDSLPHWSFRFSPSPAPANDWVVEVID
jgi:TPR repeat protein